METLELLRFALLFICAVYGDLDTTTVTENLELTVLHSNKNPQSRNIIKQNLQGTLITGENISNEHLDIGEANIIREAEDDLPKANNTERASDKPGELYSDNEWLNNDSPVDTRRILNGKKVQPGARPYMVYLNLTERSLKAKKTKGWLCGGVIIHRQYVITSAACVEDGDKFYVISGTVDYVSAYNSKMRDCITKNQRRVIWKCVPKSYNFSYIDDVKWSANDIAIAMVDRPFKLGEVEEGCQFAAEMVPYNNISRELEEPGTKGYILGWGSLKNFREQVYRKRFNNRPKGLHTKKRKRIGRGQEEVYATPPPYKSLQEAKVVLMDKEECAEHWPPKFRDVIEEYMICTKDIEEEEMSPICSEKYANCTHVDRRRELPEHHTMESDATEVIDPGIHPRSPKMYTARRSQGDTGGFCEYDHGGPLVVRHRGVDHVVGVISVCRVDTGQPLCHGPFLYTSVFQNRQFLSCTIHKDIDDDCRRVFRSGLTYQEWTVNWEDED